MTELKQAINELKQEMNKLRNEIKLSGERINKNIVQMGYKTIVVFIGTSVVMTAVLGFLIKTN